MSLEELLGRLDQVMGLASQGREIPDRHRSLRSTVDWSYNLLSQAAQRVFEEVSVFVGGFTLDAAEAVCSEGDMPAIGCVRELTSKSLVQVGSDNTPGRYRELEPIREVAGRLLASRPGVDLETRNRHAVLFQAMGHELGQRLTSAQHDDGLETLDVEMGNMRRALAWLTENDRPHEAMSLAADLGWYWYHRGQFAEGQTPHRRCTLHRGSI